MSHILGAVMKFPPLNEKLANFLKFIMELMEIFNSIMKKLSFMQ